MCHRLGDSKSSRWRNFYDNAAMERFWSSLTREPVHQVCFITRAAARAVVFEWIEILNARSGSTVPLALSITGGLQTKSST